MLMEKKVHILIVITIFLVFLTYSIITIAIPEYKKNFGSSDKFIITGQYANIFEIDIKDNAHFSLVYNKKGKINHILFFNDTSYVLYNQNIENLSLKESLDKTIQLLKNNGFYNQNIKVLYYEDEGIEEFKKIFQELLESYSITVNCSFEKANILDLAKRFDISDTNHSAILRNLDYYSKELIKDIKDKKKNQSSYYEEAANSIYERLDTYISNQNILELNRDEVIYPIQIIAADNDEKLFPNGNSWYYVHEGLLYAYIEFPNGDSYCYMGNRNNKKEGVC